jgi:hypothetical protein
MINSDKAWHFLFGLIAGVVSIYAVIAVAIGKEVYDHFHPDKHVCDAMDAVVTIIGGLTTLAILN